jgi:hypothetical protein
MFAGSVDNQYLVGASSPAGHSKQPFLRPAFGEPVISMCRTDAHTGKARGQPFCGTLTPGDLVPSMRWQADRKLLGRNRSVLWRETNEDRTDYRTLISDLQRRKWGRHFFSSVSRAPWEVTACATNERSHGNVAKEKLKCTSMRQRLSFDF